MLCFFCREHRTSRLLACFGLKIQEMFFNIAFSDYKVLSISVSEDVDGPLCQDSCRRQAKKNAGATKPA
jgi:hypothetical protein